MSKKTILTVYFILGLPGLPIACITWFFEKYIMGVQGLSSSKEGFASLMFSATIFMSLIAALVYITK